MNTINLNELLDLIREVELLTESTFDINDIAQMKYFVPILKKIENEEQFFIEPEGDGEPIYFTIKKDSPFVQQLIDTNADREKLASLFKAGGKMKAVIPSTDGQLYRLNQLGKGIFTAKVTKGGLQGTETPDMKEGLVCYFTIVGNEGLTKAYNKLKNKLDTKLDLPIEVINSQYFGKKGEMLVKNAITHLNNNEITDKKEIGLFLNAISAAITCSQLEKDTVDRGQLFEMIRSVASTITMVKPDKWCPGDIYLYNANSKGKIEEILTESSDFNNIISILNDDGSVKEAGLNQLFEGQPPLIHAVSLKEQVALSGRATEFLNVRDLAGRKLLSDKFKFDPEEMEILQSYKDRVIPKANELIPKYEAQKQANKQAFIEELSSYGVVVVEGVSKKQKAKKEESESLSENVAKKQKAKKEKEPTPPEQILGNLVSKSTCYRFMNLYFANFDKLKKTNDIMEKYDNPMLAMTAFGVSLSGFNPTFKKVVAFANGDAASITEFKGRDSLSISTKEGALYDSPDKAGFLFSFITKMGEKDYKTTLDVRFAGGFSISVIVQEFHAETHEE